MRKATVLAVLLDKNSNACGFSKPLEPAHFNGQKSFAVEIFEDIELRTAYLEFATPCGLIARNYDVIFSNSTSHAGDRIIITLGV